ESTKCAGQVRSQDGSASSVGSAAKRATPFASVTAFATAVPLQSAIETLAPSTGRASSSLVTQASDDSRPHLKCTERFVTSAAAGTNTVADLPRSALPTCPP